MANQLTLKVMASIVKRCEGYEPLPEAQRGYGASRDAGITQREEALLSSVIHRQSDASGRNPWENSGSESNCEGRAGKERQSTPNFSKNGVVSLDALLRELKK